jgi:hypothetical protein
VVERGNAEKLRSEILAVFQTGLPKFTRHIESEQRDYLWKHMDEHWVNPDSAYDKTDLTYLLARRLANTLERNSIRRFLKGEKAAGPQETDDTIYPIEMYIFPSTNPKFSAGDLLKGTFQGKDGYWVVLTPSCDLDRGKVSNVILAECLALSEQPEVKNIHEALAGKQPLNDVKGALLSLLSNRRQGKNMQPERYYFLPGTFFLPNLVADFQELRAVPFNELKIEDRIATLDSPFAEACLAGFSRYYGRLGTPDLDKNFVSNKIIESIQREIQNLSNSQ